MYLTRVRIFDKMQSVSFNKALPQALRSVSSGHGYFVGEMKAIKEDCWFGVIFDFPQKGHDSTKNAWDIVGMYTIQPITINKSIIFEEDDGRVLYGINREVSLYVDNVLVRGVVSRAFFVFETWCYAIELWEAEQRDQHGVQFRTEIEMVVS